MSKNSLDRLAALRAGKDKENKTLQAISDGLGGGYHKNDEKVADINEKEFISANASEKGRGDLLDNISEPSIDDSETGKKTTGKVKEMRMTKTFSVSVQSNVNLNKIKLHFAEQGKVVSFGEILDKLIAGYAKKLKLDK